jgi:hypothetical protein
MKLTPVTALLCIAAFGLSAFSGCKEDEIPDPVTPTPTPTTSLKIAFTNVVGASPLTLGTTLQYQNLNGDSFAVTTYKYYISNIRLTDNNNNTWSEPESYHLINHANPASCVLTLTGMPAATYTSVTFMIGVDSARNVSGAQTGALDPANDMFWTWNSGYIMAKFEGKSPSSTIVADNVFLHVAGFGGQYAAQRTVSPTFGSSTAIVTTTTIPQINVTCDVQEWFQNPTPIDFSSVNNINTTGAMAATLANNYVDMFTVTSITN